LADSQTNHRLTDRITDTRLPAATKPLQIQRFLTLAKVALPASPAWQGGTDVARLAFPSPDAALGDGDSAARCPNLYSISI
jgi:hypothetical protein